jgi:glycosyltransferase involved in cell wall biosynthesis
MILVNCLSALQGGGQTYLLQLFSHLPLELRNKVLILAHTRNQLLWEQFGLRIITSEMASKSILHRTCFETFILPRLIRTERILVYFAPGGILPGWKHHQVKMVTTFQNMLPFAQKERWRYPWGYTRLRLYLLRFALVRSFQKADLVIFLSRYAQQVIDQVLPARRGKSIVIPHGLDEHFRFQKERSFPQRISGEYVLYVSILDVYKAQLEVIHAWHRLRQQRPTGEKLVLIGPEYPYYSNKVKALICELRLEQEVLLLGKIPYEDLPSYYQHAKINLFASSCENCPNILLEALAAGKPVFCSNYPPMPEFGGDAVEYFDPYVPAELTNLFLKYLDNDQLREELGKKAFQQSLRFDWKTSADRTWQLLAELLEA